MHNFDHRDFNKHMLHLHHRDHIKETETSEVILLNNHCGSSCYQMTLGMLLFFQNGIVCGQTFGDVRVYHKGDIV